MAVSAVPFALQNVPINADVVREAVSSLVPNGGGVTQAGDYAVAQLSTPGMGVQVGVGRAWVTGSNIANLPNNSYSKQGMYYVLNDASVTLTIGTADSTNPRIDTVYLSVQDSAYVSGATDGATLAVAQGQPAASPVAPGIPSNAIALANVAVAANATSITTSNITAQTVPVIGPSTIAVYTPVSPSGYTNQGQVTVQTVNGRSVVTCAFQVKYTNSTNITIGTSSYANFGSLIPSQAQSPTAFVQYLSGNLDGNSANTTQQIEVFINPSTGVVEARSATGSSITLSSGMFFTVNCTYTI